MPILRPERERRGQPKCICTWPDRDPKCPALVEIKASLNEWQELPRS